MTKKPETSLAYIALGANLGDAPNTFQKALAALKKWPQTRLIQLSSLYQTAPLNCPESSPDFINAVAKISTGLDPLALLLAMQEEEKAQGRIRAIPNAPRVLDMDLLLYENQVIHAPPTLILPHPRLHLRAFVLHPLTEIAPEITLPQRGKAAAWLPAVATQKIKKLEIPIAAEP